MDWMKKVMRFWEDETAKGNEKKSLWENDEEKKNKETEDNKSDVKEATGQPSKEASY